ncbi:hypothetical protein EET67_22455 [Pseudaminobacter arsenicus]|uniref:Uncharacterized protein n=1 Tax=Borborobacter arsenicus TaxID=1851146 RepID=A0A432V058_9HYPH|nr:hypothetical protein [Pseudaminobacter arsenicus]RUM95594.1 hypothetical protein EET67_22455 [Pseudaminobacter arsenicus]
MKCLRLAIAILILRGAGIFAGVIAGPELREGRRSLPPLRPAERMLLGSLVGLTICVLWIWISMGAGR